MARRDFGVPRASAKRAKTAALALPSVGGGGYAQPQDVLPGAGDPEAGDPVPGCPGLHPHSKATAAASSHGDGAGELSSIVY